MHTENDGGSCNDLVCRYCKKGRLHLLAHDPKGGNRFACDNPDCTRYGSPVSVRIHVEHIVPCTEPIDPRTTQASLMLGLWWAFLLYMQKVATDASALSDHCTSELPRKQERSVKSIKSLVQNALEDCPYCSGALYLPEAELRTHKSLEHQMDAD
ncbi:hypothetical protein NTE_02500 [Candidatus Nitrososphaera evergladensis SR1]|jgi:hypothetical protein|uniref:Uncharacterized protein n=1 Tax=Candidatus Nitrososphaera evergladensis SR1 TaxID=1459636 RepID=A0A075MZ72_9ARCH|nr:hypothetical protein NTE_02500 [Candidatus Nitrososphaera evergladensis SR1]